MPADFSKGDYRRVAAELRRNGAATFLRTEHQLVVATTLPAFPDASNSFWLRFHANKWHLVTWAPRVYRIPQSADVVEVSLECLRSSSKTVAVLPEDLVTRFSLELLAENESGPVLQ